MNIKNEDIKPISDKEFYHDWLDKPHPFEFWFTFNPEEDKKMHELGYKIREEQRKQYKEYLQ